MKEQFKKGVSVLLCCYNSANRIKQTLYALSRQKFESPVPWEIILVDNASTDHTAEIAASVWEKLNTGMTLRCVPEPVAGLANARRRGIAEASFSIILFCDDDNWLSESYVDDVYQSMENDPSVAACGGNGIPVFETERPAWFNEYAEAFALGSQEINNENGCIINLYGAGLAIRKNIIIELYETGFKPVMQGRIGNKLSSAEDTELTYAFVLMGYKLQYHDKLKFYHFLPKERLTLNYLKKLFVAFGSDGPVRNLYYANISSRPIHKQIRNWSFHFGLSLVRLLKYFIVPPKKYGRSIYFNWNIAYIKELLSIRNCYSKIDENIFKIKKIAK